jgi:energy-coupling factor transporter transmembrane protein EcfT
MTVNSSLLLMLILMAPLLFGVAIAAAYWKRVSRPWLFMVFCFAVFYAAQGITYSVAFNVLGAPYELTDAMHQSKTSSTAYLIGDGISLVSGVILAHALASAMPRRDRDSALATDEVLPRQS